MTSILRKLMTEVLSNRLAQEVIPIYDSDEYGRDHGVAREPMFLMLLACGEAASDQIRLAQHRDLSCQRSHTVCLIGQM